MANCSKCGYELSKNTKFCNHCGASAVPPEPPPSRQAPFGRQQWGQAPTGAPSGQPFAPMGGAKPASKKPKPILIIILAVVVLALVGGAVALAIHLLSGFSESPENAQLATGAAAVIDEDDLTGNYILSSMTTAGVTMNYDDLQTAEMEMMLTITGEEASLTAYGSTSPVELDTSAKTIVLQSVVMDYVIDGESIVATGENEGYEMVFVFTSENSSLWNDASGGGINATGFVAPGYGTEETMPVETLVNPSNWYGIVSISDYVGNHDISGEYEAWGYIGSDEYGNYFELYINGPVDSGYESDLMSFNIELHDYSFFPIVDEYAWLYGDAPLKEEDNTWYVPSLTNGVLSASYNYDYNGETFIMDFSIAQIVDGGAVASAGGGMGDTMENNAAPASVAPAPEASAPQPAAPQASFTTDELRQIYLDFQELDIDEKFSLTYEDVLSRYFNGVEGNVTNQTEDIVSYQWVSIESETSLLNMSFERNEDGTFTYKSMSINNIDYE